MLCSFRLGAAVGLLLAIAWAQRTASEKATTQPEDPCATVQGQRQANFCAAEQYEKSDVHRKALYHEIENDLQRYAQTAGAEQKMHEEQALAQLQAAEQAWTQYRDLHCRAASDFFQGTIRPAISSECMKRVTEHRIEDLKFAYPVDGRLRK
jgi:uncharacterized protein YecT (DUF1311 family)